MRIECEMRLFNTIARNHGVALEDVFEARERLGDNRLDIAVILPIVMLYWFVVVRATGWVRRRFPRDEAWPALVATLFASLAISATVVLLGGLWAGTVEMLRVGNLHLSYRALRLPWRQQYSQLFIVGVVLFWLVALIRYRFATDEDQVPETLGSASML